MKLKPKKRMKKETHKQFCSRLLRNPRIRAAYESAEPKKRVVNKSIGEIFREIFLDMFGRIEKLEKKVEKLENIPAPKRKRT